MSMIRKLIVMMAVMVLTACGGGGGDDDKYSIAISISQASFLETQNVMPTKPIDVDVTFNGDGLVVGYPPNVQPANWLDIQVISNTNTTAKVRLSFIGYFQPGKFSTTVRFVTGKQDGSALTYVDLPVSAEVVQQFDVTAPALNFVQIIGDEANTSPKAGYNFAISGPRSTWSVSSNVDWLTLSKTSGAGADQVKLTVSKNAGAGNAIITFTDSQSNRSKQFNVSVERKQNALQITPQALEIAVGTTTTLAELTKTLTITDTVNSTVAGIAVPWNFKSSSATWLKVDKTAGSTANTQTLQVSVDNSINALPTGTFNEKLIFTYVAGDNVEREVQVPVKVTSTLPSVQVVAPYVLKPNAAGSFIVRGYGFSRLTASSRVKIGDNFYPIKSLDSDTQLKVEHSGFATGRYPVSLDLNSTVPLKTATLVVQSRETPTSQELLAPGTRNTMVYDNERNRVYAYNKTLAQIEVFSLRQGQWVLSHTTSFAEVTDLALTKDGQQLLAAVDAQLWSIDITKDNLPATMLLDRGDGFSCKLYFKNIATLNDNKVALAMTYTNCSGFTSAIVYDLAQRKEFGSYLAYNSSVAASGDGSRLLISQNGVSPEQEIQLIDTLDYKKLPTSAFGNVSFLDMNQDGSKIIAGENQLYDGQLNRLGTLGRNYESFNYDRLSQSRAVSWRLQFNARAPYEPQLKELDISGQANGDYPVARTIDFSDISEDMSWPNVQFEITPDDQVFILSVPGKMIFRPIPQPVN